MQAFGFISGFQYEFSLVWEDFKGFYGVLVGAARISDSRLRLSSLGIRGLLLLYIIFGLTPGSTHNPKPKVPIKSRSETLNLKYKLL